MASLTQWTWVWVNSGVDDGQGGLACCGLWGHKEQDTSERLNWNELRCDVLSSVIETGNVYHTIYFFNFTFSFCPFRDDIDWPFQILNGVIRNAKVVLLLKNFVYITIYRMDDQCKFNPWSTAPGLELCATWRDGVARRSGGVVRIGRIHIYVWPIHVDV